jgi:hypothetical protein
LALLDEPLTRILQGSADKVVEAGAVVVGGHSIDDEEPKFGLAVTGTGVFLRSVGWRVLPGKPLNDDVIDLRLKLAPRWNLDEDGVWRKACSRCGELKPLDGYYDTNYRTGKDPKRHVCIACFHLPKKEAL